MMTAAEIAFRLHGRKSGAGYVVRCPGHDDHEPSLSLRDAAGKVLVHCHAGCEQRRVIDALKALGLWPPEREQRADRRIVTTYDYRDANGVLVYQVCRTDPKGFFQRVPDGAGGWINREPRDEERVLFHLIEVLENPIIFVCEGEKDVERLREHGFAATCEAGGANARWLPQFTDALRGREAVLIPDNDAPGRQRVLTIARALMGHVAKLVVLTLDDPHVKDVSDWFAAGHSEVELINMLDGEGVTR